MNQIWSAVLCMSLESCRQLACLLVVVFLWLADATMTDQCLQGTGWCSSVIPVSQICPLKKSQPEKKTRGESHSCVVLNNLTSASGLESLYYSKVKGKIFDSEL